MDQTLHELTPDQTFGILVHRECGLQLDQIAQRLDVPLVELSRYLQRVDNGDGPRMPPVGDGPNQSSGSPYSRSKRIHSDGAVDECFQPRWMRVIVRTIVRNGGEISVAQTCVIRAGYDLGSTRNEALHIEWRRLGIRWRIDVRDKKGFYVLDAKGLETLKAVIDNRWLAPGAGHGA